MSDWTCAELCDGHLYYVSAYDQQDGEDISGV